MVSLFANKKIKKPNAAHDVRTIVNYTREINFGSAIFRLIYEKLGLDKYFAQKTQFYKLDFNLGRELASAAIAVEDARFVFIEDKSRTGTDLSEKTALHEIIENAEEHILTRFYLE